jgi:hypothetical protein
MCDYRLRNSNWKLGSAAASTLPVSHRQKGGDSLYQDQTFAVGLKVLEVYPIASTYQNAQKFSDIWIAKFS